MSDHSGLLPPLFWSSCACATAAALLYASFTLIYPIVVPPIQPYPWQLPTDDDYAQKQKDKNTTVVIAGSYNPPHRGHLLMISYLSERYGKVIVVLGMNPKKTYDVTPAQRRLLLRTMLQSLPNVHVEVVSGYIWRFAKKEKARIFFRGIRTWEKDGADERQLQILNTWGPLLLGPLYWPIPTRFLEGAPEYNHISSTLIRNVAAGSAQSAPPSSNTTSRDAAPEQSQVDTIHQLVPESIAKDVILHYAK